MNIRLSEDIRMRLDRLVEHQRTLAVPGSRVSRHAVACWLLEEGLKAAERDSCLRGQVAMEPMDVDGGR